VNPGLGYRLTRDREDQLGDLLGLVHLHEVAGAREQKQL
jgi:hypothetical protein